MRVITWAKRYKLFVGFCFFVLVLVLWQWIATEMFVRKIRNELNKRDVPLVSSDLETYPEKLIIRYVRNLHIKDRERLEPLICGFTEKRTTVQEATADFRGVLFDTYDYHIGWVGTLFGPWQITLTYYPDNNGKWFLKYIETSALVKPETKIIEDYEIRAID